MLETIKPIFCSEMDTVRTQIHSIIRSDSDDEGFQSLDTDDSDELLLLKTYNKFRVFTTEESASNKLSVRGLLGWECASYFRL